MIWQNVTTPLLCVKLLSISVKRYLFYLAGFTERRMSRVNAAEIGSFFQLGEKYVAGAHAKFY